MGRDYIGKNGKGHHLSYRQDYIIFSFLGQLVGKEIDFQAASERECKDWAALIRNNLHRMRLLTPDDERARRLGTQYGIIDGADIRQLFSVGLYSARKVSPSKLEGALIEPLNEEWKWQLLEFAEFLDSCGGIMPAR